MEEDADGLRRHLDGLCTKAQLRERRQLFDDPTQIKLKRLLTPQRPNLSYRWWRIAKSELLIQP